MAGGKGTRLLPYTALMPKPLMPIGDAPVLEWLLRQLREAGIEHVYLAVLHHRQLIQAYFGDGTAMGMHIRYAVEEKPLGTCGPVTEVLDEMTDDFLLLNADLVTDLDFRKLLSQHKARKAEATVALQRHRVTQEFGVADLDENARVVRLREKPSTEHLLVMGVYVLNKDGVRRHLTPNERLDMPDLLTGMLTADQRVNGYESDCLWLDIGRPDDYARAQNLAESGAFGGRNIASATE